MARIGLIQDRTSNGVTTTFLFGGSPQKKSFGLRALGNTNSFRRHWKALKEV